MQGALILVLSTFILRGSSFKIEELTKDDLLHYFGTVDHSQVSGYDTTVVSRRDTGAHKRSVEATASYSFNALGEKFKLSLEMNLNLFSNDFVIERIGANGSSTLDKPKNTNCYYVGSSANHNNSLAAVSTCNGLEGMVNTGKNSFFIKPLKPEHRRRRSLRSTDGETTHVVFTREDSAGTCGVTPDDEGEQLLRTRSLDTEIAPGKLVTGKKNLETLIVAGHTMFSHYGNDVEKYLQVIMNIVASIFSQNSIGVDMQLTVIRFVIIEEESNGPNLKPDTYGLEAHNALKSFCDWHLERYKALNPDVAAIVTRYDLYRKSDDGSIDSKTTGLAGVGVTCNAANRCSINEDSGLGTATTIAHEMGHNLGMKHDGDKNDCSPMKNVMASMTAQGMDGMQWSTCSAHYLNVYLQEREVNCLDNSSPADIFDISLNGRFPGEVYSTDEQCKFTFEDSIGECNFKKGDCTELWCEKPGNECFTMGTPMLEGTECLPGKWCRKGVCTDFGSEGPAAVDGGWSEFDSAWSDCSRTCGGGMRSKTRRCDNPPPAFGGKVCQGESIIYDICNLQYCESSQLLFVEEQCAQQRDHPSGEGFEWQPNYYYNLESFCKMNCARIEGQTIYSLEFGEFIDGSRCDFNDSYGGYKMCIAGRCENVGCDGKLNSGKLFDICGICGGDGSQCSPNTGVQKVGVFGEFTEVVTIPVGATNVIAMDKGKYTFLGMKFNGEMVIGTGNQRSQTGLASAGLDTIYYSRDEPDYLTIKGPTTASIEIMVFKQYGSEYGDVVQPMAGFRYYQKNAGGVAKWTAGPWSTCSKSCGSGKETRDVTCTLDGQLVANTMCNDAQPIDQRSCDAGTCPVNNWIIGKYGQCSVTCGDGIRVRTVTCRSSADKEKLPDSECNPDTKPDGEPEPCSKPACTTKGCNMKHDADSGSFSSPNYPNKYMANADCVTKIRVKNRHRVRITFNVFKLQNSGNCQKDYVRLTDEGTGTEAIFCGSRSSFEWTSETNMVKVEFHSDKGTSKKGFQADYESFEAEETEADAASCDMTLAGSKGSISSPNYPDHNYDNNDNCKVVIDANDNDNIEVTFEEFELEEAPNCIYDYLKITHSVDGKLTSSKYCGSRVDMVLQFTGGITLLFHSDESATYKGYHATYRIIKDRRKRSVEDTQVKQSVQVAELPPTEADNVINRFGPEVVTVQLVPEEAEIDSKIMEPELVTVQLVPEEA
ncbi:A disintegrin and metalloproteinase with thrombospondin motifs 18-like [Anneissia japonica]|uniref:A disintegrin and metalloproteinase with thrombospondin motifs 18-like n=1 Tax=Anneissia japonica TaxID=1529436 RepID=UPI0014258016|nr:A disintegrin and metalloproteinase with thrombospondin motifs 18-like [Anneissia japonica]